MGCLIKMTGKVEISYNALMIRSGAPFTVVFWKLVAMFPMSMEILNDTEMCLTQVDCRSETLCYQETRAWKIFVKSDLNWTDYG